MPHAMEIFIKDVAEIVQAGGTEEAITAQVAEKLGPILSDPELLPAHFTQPLETGYALYPVYVAPDQSFSIAAAVWGVGMYTGIHDHGTWGVIGIYSGAEHEERFLRAENAPLDQPAGIEKLGTRVIPSGEVFVCCTSDKDIHRVSADGDQPSVGIHVYGGDIGKIKRHSYDLDSGIASTLVTLWDIETPLYS